MEVALVGAAYGAAPQYCQMQLRFPLHGKPVAAAAAAAVMDLLQPCATCTGNFQSVLDPPSSHCRYLLSVGACHVVVTSCKREKEAKRRPPLDGFSDPHDHSMRRQLLLRAKQLRSASLPGRLN